jgi:hypothetical protein
MKMPFGFNTTLLIIKSGIDWQVRLKSIARWMTDFHFSYILLKKSKESYRKKQSSSKNNLIYKDLTIKGSLAILYCRKIRLTVFF